ncbi:DUF2637 domain-containing protein, partial [Kitasatospora indigofera]|uniref:DUF2637 domain-containing protein n=1 Tax=Kitasatospora indigofera TaxID=67307 RepID=UPI0036447736
MSNDPGLRRRRTVSWWDLAAIGLLGTAGFVLSYDALQQMADAIHVRGKLTYAFPLIIDGFIAYGVRALVLLREARWTARAYAWSLFAGATAASIWANALHAVRLNQETFREAGLRLGDATVGLLSTLAPLALAGAVHLGILIARHGGMPPPASGETTTDTPMQLTAHRADPSQPARALRSVGAGRAHTSGLDRSASTTQVEGQATADQSATPVPASADDKLRAHSRGTRLRDRIAQRLLRHRIKAKREAPVLVAPADGPSSPSGGADGPLAGAAVGGRLGVDGLLSPSGGADGLSSASGADRASSPSGAAGGRSGADGPSSGTVAADGLSSPSG